MTTPESVIPPGAARLGAIAALDAIVLREVDWKVNDVSAEGGDIDLEAEYNVFHGRAGARLRFQVRSRVTGKRGTTEVFRSVLVHEAYFSLPDGAQATDGELESFGSFTVFFMVFPYIRQFVHLLTGNAGLPALLLAPFRIPVDPATVALPPAQTQTPELPAPAADMAETTE
jgi:hypothetical protein